MINLILKLMENEALKTAFLKLANMSISASWLVLAILVLRLVLKKAPKWVNVLLWGVVAVRLVCPFSIESALSLIPSTQTIPMNIEMAAKPAIDSGVEVVNSIVNPMIAASFTPNPAASANPLQIWIPLAAVIWLFGMVLLFLYTAISYWRLNRRIDTAVLFRDNIFQSENVSSPFVLGIIKPKIYLPFHMNEQDLHHVVAHEQAHILRKDHWWKPLGFLLLTVHWFNPLMWLAYVLLCRDIELACDEKVIKELDNEQRADYTQALVSCSINRRMIAACPLAFGEVGVKDRVKTIMNYKKPTFWLILVALILCVIVAVCFLTDPIQEKNSLSFLNYKHSISMSEYQDVIPAVHYTSENDQGSIGIGMVEGKAFATYLDTVQWTEKWFTPTDLSSPGSVAVNIADNLRITIYDRNFAAVEFNDEVCYYRIKANDYQRIQDLLMPADSERLEMASETRLELALGVVTIKENDTQTEKQRLSLNDVIILSQKGYDLTWADFEQFKYIETGFGLYIRRYEINDLFHFSIGGAGPNSNPMYMHLGVNGEDPNAYIDIREGGVTKFISEHNSDSSELWDRIPMVMVNGELYLDTGKESTVIARCGMMDGEITSQVPGNEEPTVNDQSNFGIGYGYQYGAIEGTIEINMNGKWWIFATEAVRQEIQFPTEGTDPELMIDPVVPVSVVNLITGEERIITSNADIRTIQMITSSEWWAEGNPGCDNDFKITINGETYWYHSDCGTLNDINNDRCISLDESKCKEINIIVGITQDLELERFYLTIGAEGVKTIELTMPNSIDACENEDGSLFKKGDRILLECLDGYKDLRGVSITALGENGEILWTASIPDGEDNAGFTHLRNDDWNITNIH